MARLGRSAAIFARGPRRTVQQRGQLGKGRGGSAARRYPRCPAVSARQGIDVSLRIATPLVGSSGAPDRERKAERFLTAHVRALIGGEVGRLTRYQRCVCVRLRVFGLFRATLINFAQRCSFPVARTCVVPTPGGSVLVRMGARLPQWARVAVTVLHARPDVCVWLCHAPPARVRACAEGLCAEHVSVPRALREGLGGGRPRGSCDAPRW